MSNLGDLVKDITGKDAGALGKAGDVIGTLADVSGAIGLVEMGIGLIDSLTAQDNQMQDLMNALQSDFGQMQAQAAAEDKLARMRDIDSGINPASAVFAQLPAIVSSSSPPTHDFVLEQIQKCVGSVLFFTDNDDKWECVAAGYPYYSDGWNGSLAPTPGSDGLVFNYTYTLPQFMRSIYILLTTIAALDRASLPSYMDVLSRAITRLETVHDTIVDSGIVGTRLPTVANADSWWMVDSTTNEVNYYPYGAIEIYSGASLVRSYMVDYFDFEVPDWGAWGVTAQFFLKLLQLRIVKQMKALYGQIGLPAVWQTLNRLKQLAGQPVPTTPEYDAWPYSEVLALLGITLPPAGVLRSPIQVFNQEPAGMEAALKKFLLETPPYIAFDIFGADPEIDPRTHKKIPTKVHPRPLPQTDLYTFLTGVSATGVVERQLHIG